MHRFHREYFLTLVNVCSLIKQKIIRENEDIQNTDRQSRPWMQQDNNFFQRKNFPAFCRYVTLFHLTHMRKDRKFCLLRIKVSKRNEFCTYEFRHLYTQFFIIQYMLLNFEI